ncbi:uncharacterized protein LOC109718771 [Ananas comosus]|uniref:Uncharacterized protein LOC109718771 n=1 Tax=Ananas comosus TaxID=4615 RepID=A0A199W2A8_ANACO|nr:uncharacterized protein LOC109718771 [Ananas comosus]OAY83444.1 hypothetical protein ACMD2_00245 [Ananas comosus]
MSQESHSVTLQINQLESGNEGENEQQTKVVRDQLKRIIFFSVAIITMASAILLAFLNGAKDIRAMQYSSTVIKAYNFFIWPTLQCPILLLMYAFFLFGRYNRINRNQKIYLISAITISSVLLIVTSFFSLVLLNKDSAGMSLIVIPVIAIICFLGYRATQNVHDRDSVNHESYKPEQKKAFKFATTIATMAITVQTGMIYASFKSPPLQALQSFQLALCLFFLITMVGIFVMMVTSIPLTVHYSFWRGSLLSFVRYSSAAILVLLGLSAAALAMQFLETLVVGVFLLVLVPICVYFTQDIGISLRDPTSARPLYHDPRYAGVMRYGIATLVSFNGGLLAAICVASVGIAPQQDHMSLGIRVCAFFQLLAIESGLIWIGLMFEPQHGEMWASIVEIFYSVSLLLQIVMIMAGAVMLFIVLS